MSAHYGYYHIEFLKRDGSPDVETAQRAFEWCQDEYDWFDEVDITLEDHCIIGDGLGIKYTDVPDEDSIEDWIQDIGDEVDAELILAGVLFDRSESYSNGDGNFHYDLVYENGELETEDYEFNHNLYGIVVGYDEYLVTDYDFSGKIYRGLFRNKKTGVKKNLGYLLIDDSGFYRFWRDDELDGAPAAYVCNDEGETVEAPNEDIYNYSCFGIEDDEGSVSNVPPCEVLSSWQIKTDSDEILDVSEWEFVGFNACEKYNLLDRTRARVRTPTVVVIPEGTTTIEDGAYSGYTHISSVEIPSSVTSIGSSAFSGCKGLTSVTIPDGVTKIGDWAFRGCKGLTSVTIPDGVTSIGDWAFADCEGLTSVTIPDGVTSIGLRSFQGCTGLTSVTIPDSVTEIGEDSFSGCTGLTSVTIPDSVTSIGDGAFKGCEGLTSVTIPDGVTSIGKGAFEGCNITSLEHPCLKIENGLVIKDGVVLYYASQSTSVIIPDGVTSIGSSAFRGCKGLTSVTIPDSVTSIGREAFMYCEGLTSVTIPDSVTSIGEQAFDGCKGLTSVTIPSSVTSIGSSAFSGCKGLTSVTIPDSVTSIGKYAFWCCKGLTSVTIPDSVTEIGEKAFWGCEGLTSVTIPDGVTEIGKEAFERCYGLTSVTIPDSVTSIGEEAFEDCPLDEATRARIEEIRG